MPNFTSLTDMAKALKKSEKEVMKLVEEKEIPNECYCFPVHFGDGHQIAFFADEVLKIKFKTKPKKEKEAPIVKEKEKEEDQSEEAPKEKEKEEAPKEEKEKEIPAEKK